MRTFVATILLFTRFSSYAAEKAGVVVDHMVVYKHDRKLVLLSDGKALKSYRIALGGDPVGPKARQGDHRTPEGSYAWDSRNPNGHSCKAFHLSYPRFERSNDITSAKKLGVSPGGDIMLHGLPKDYAWVGKTHTLHDWTDGCVAVTNEEIDEIWKLVRIGSPIEIKP